MSRYAKFYTAIAAALAVALSVTTDGNLSLHDWMAILSAGVGAAGVYAIPNDSRPPLDVRHPAGRDRGAVDGILIVLVVFALAIGYLWATR